MISAMLRGKKEEALYLSARIHKYNTRTVVESELKKEYVGITRVVQVALGHTARSF